MSGEPSLSSKEIMVKFCNYWYAASFFLTEGKDNYTLDVDLGAPDPCGTNTPVRACTTVGLVSTQPTL